MELEDVKKDNEIEKPIDTKSEISLFFTNKDQNSNNNKNEFKIENNQKERSIIFSILSNNENDVQNTTKNNEANSLGDTGIAVDNNTMCTKSNINIDNIANINFDSEKSKEDNSLQVPDNNNSFIEIKNLKLKRLNYFEMFKCGLNIRYNCNKYVFFVKNKENISLNCVKDVKVYGNGNFLCFYKCLSMFLYNKEDYFDAIKKAVIEYCQIT